MQIDYKQARSLCTATEFALLEDTKPKVLTGFSAAQLKQKATTARKYADKWREQALRAGNSTDGSGARSKTKHELFQEALLRFEARLKKVTAPVPAAKTAKKAAKTAKKAAAKPAKKSADKAARKLAKKMAKKAARKATKTSGPSTSPVAKKATQGSSRPLAVKATQKAIGTDLRIATSGLSSRIRGHVSASGRRNQAARSSRKRS